MITRSCVSKLILNLIWTMTSNGKLLRKKGEQIMAYYEILFGSGFYESCRYVMKTDYPTTNGQALTDVLIDHLKEKRHPNILEYVDCTPDEKDGNMIGITDSEGNYFGYDQYVTGGNCSDILLTYGDFRINEISENEIKDAEIVEV